MADLLELANSDQLLLMLNNVFLFIYKTSYLNEEVNCTEPSPSVCGTADLLG
jgi:hypothetical protein